MPAVMKNKPTHLVSLFLCLTLVACSSSEGISGTAADAGLDGKSELASERARVETHNLNIWPVVKNGIEPDEYIEATIKQLLAKMTLEEKVGQMLQPELRVVTPADVKEFHIGSILNGGGAFPNDEKYATVDDWVATADTFYDASMDDSDGAVSIPIIWGTDAVHGHNNVFGATLFPHNIGLGATNNPELIRQIARATAIEVAVTGIDWIFAPTVATVRNDLWGRTYEGYSEDPDIVKAYAGMIVTGMQGQSDTPELLDSSHVVATAKHFVGDGGTANGIDRGDNLATEQELFDIHAQGYVSAIEAGVQTVMASFNAWQGKRLHGHRYLLTDVLKHRMGFDGLVVGDWNGHSFVEGCNSVSCPQAINAGIDLLMASEPDWKTLYLNTLAQVRNGTISEVRIDDAVSRILRVKLRAGLFDNKPSARPLSGQRELIGSPQHRALARQAVRESLVLLKNTQQLLPLDRNLNVLVAGDAADNIGKQSGGWTLSWQGTGNTNKDFPGATSIFAGIQQIVDDAGGTATLSQDGKYSNRPDVAIVVFGENPYAEGQGDRQTLEYQPGEHHDLALLQKFQADGIPVVSIFLSGRPLWVNRELNASDAFVAAWLPGSEGAGIAEVIFRAKSGESQYPMVGKLAFSWPKDTQQTTLNRGDTDYQPLFPYGFGLSYGDIDTLGDDLSEQVFKSVTTGLKPLQIFNRRAMSPWELVIDDEQGAEAVFSGSRLENGSMSIVSVDQLSQEDSRQVNWLGGRSGTVALTSDDSYDLSPYAGVSSVLSFSARLSQAPTSPLIARLQCGEACFGEIDITDNVAALNHGEWTRLAIDLKCFAQAEMDFSKVSTPFSLATSGMLGLAFGNVVYEANAQKNADISC